MNYFKRIWKFLKEDTWQSWLVSLVLIVVIIKFIFFPFLSFVTGSPLPLVVIESCSLYHETSFDSWWEKNGEWYGSKEISKSEFEDFQYKNGLNKGDIILVWGYSDYNLGDIIIFEPGEEALARYPIIHRLISLDPLGTKGDHNPGQLTSGSPLLIDETNIPEENVLGKAVFRIPLAGWIKLVFFEFGRPSSERGFCR